MRYRVSFDGYRLSMVRNGLQWLPRTEVFVARPGAGSEQARIEAKLDTGCAASIFRFRELQAAGIDMPRGQALTRTEFEPIFGEVFEAFAVTLQIQIGLLPSRIVNVHATEEDIGENLIGVDLLQGHFSAYDFGEGQVYLSDPGQSLEVSELG